MKHDIKKHGMMQCNDCNYVQPSHRIYCGRCGVRFCQDLRLVPKLHRTMLKAVERKKRSEIAKTTRMLNIIKNARNYTIL